MNKPSGNKDPSPDLVEMVEGMTYNVGSAVMALWHGDLRDAQWYISREIGRLETPPAKEISGRPARPATIRIGRWDYEAEISGEGIASYENRAGDPVQTGPDRYKVIRWH